MWNHTTWVCVPGWSASAGRCCGSSGVCGTAGESGGGSVEGRRRGTSSGIHRASRTQTVVSAWWAGRRPPHRRLHRAPRTWCWRPRVQENKGLLLFLRRSQVVQAVHPLTRCLTGLTMLCMVTWRKLFTSTARESSLPTCRAIRGHCWWTRTWVQDRALPSAVSSVYIALSSA